MKYINSIHPWTFILLIGISGCIKSDLLNQYPQDQISDGNFWNSANDLRLYCNNFYQTLPILSSFGTSGIYTADENSDNLADLGRNRRLNGEGTVPVSGGGWAYANWSDIRNVNHFIANWQKVKAPFDDVKTYIGEAYFFRAWYYYEKLRAFGALPWINKPLSTEDSAYLSQPRMPRNTIADSIVADLNIAISYLDDKSRAGTMRIYKELAEAFKSRVCLYEGTWEKYHQGTAFGVPGSNGEKYLEMAVQAAEDVINSSVFALDNIGQPDGYRNVFNQIDYSNSREVMFWRKYSLEEGIYHHWIHYSYSGAGTGVTKSLVDSYLCMDGNPIAVSDLYKGDDSLETVIQNRDPRLGQTIYTPGSLVWANTPNGVDQIFEKPALDIIAENLNTTGYQLYKGHNTDYSLWNPARNSIVGLIFMRYAEILLNFAEAKAELGTITQQDVDNTINVLRNRVNMAPLVLADIAIDPEWQFPALSAEINEIRRERRVELACEGYRFDDICRWAAAPQLIVGWRPLGASWDQWENRYKDGQGNPTVVPGNNIFVNSDGYIVPFMNDPSMTNGYQFDLSRDYLLPLPTLELTLNSNLEQNPGWE